MSILHCGRDIYAAASLVAGNVVISHATGLNGDAAGIQLLKERVWQGSSVPHEWNYGSHRTVAWKTVVLAPYDSGSFEITGYIVPLQLAMCGVRELSTYVGSRWEDGFTPDQRDRRERGGFPWFQLSPPGIATARSDLLTNEIITLRTELKQARAQIILQSDAMCKLKKLVQELEQLVDRLRGQPSATQCEPELRRVRGI